MEIHVYLAVILHSSFMASELLFIYLFYVLGNFPVTIHAYELSLRNVIHESFIFVK